MKPGSVSPYEAPKKMSKGRSFSQCTKAPPLKGMAGFANAGRIGGKVVAGGAKT